MSEEEQLGAAIASFTAAVKNLPPVTCLRCDRESYPTPEERAEHILGVGAHLADENEHDRGAKRFLFNHEQISLHVLELVACITEGWGEAGSDGQGSVVPYGFAGSVAERRTVSGSAGASLNDRSRSSAPGSENCVAPRPATK